MAVEPRSARQGALAGVTPNDFCMAAGLSAIWAIAISHSAKRNRTARRTEALIFGMTRRFLKLLLSTYFIITAFGQYSKIFAADVQIGGKGSKPLEPYGYFEVDEPEKYIFSYARVPGSKTEFGVGITTPTQTMSNNGLVVPTALFVDCKSKNASFNQMQGLPAENVEKWVLETMMFQGLIFCSLHKSFFKHSYW